MNIINQKRRVVAICLAVLFLVSSLGISVSAHFCQGAVKSLSFLGKASSCEMLVNGRKTKCQKQEECTVEESDHSCFEKEPCCIDRSFFFKSCLESTQALKIVAWEISLDFIPSTNSYLRIEALHSIIEKCGEIHGKEPPSLSISRSILYQVFLI